MTPRDTATALVAGVALLERAIGYTLGSLLLVGTHDLRRRTPCTGWDLAALLGHMDDSLLALHEASTGRCVALDPVTCRDAEDVSAVAVVNRLRKRACRLLGGWNRAEPGSAADDGLVSVGGRYVTSSLVAAAGALEIAVHGWDVARACGRLHPVPAPLAEELLELAPLLVRPAERPGRFAPPVAVAPSAPAGDRLVAFLGRRPA